MAKEDFLNINTELPHILQKMLAGESLTAEELLLLEAWKNESADNQLLFERLHEPAIVQEMLTTWHLIERNRELNKLKGMSRIAGMTSETAAPVHFLRRRFVRYAAAAAIFLGAGIYTWTVIKPVDNKDGQGMIATEVIAPGREGAILTLADGSKVVLDSMGNGVVANQGGARVFLHNGQLGYTPAGNAEAAYNTISTPKGRQFRLLLPDGTKVWLNAASAVKYPTAFTGSERRIELAGEAYFEVAKNAGQPFKVITNGTEVAVLGTSFNINAYDNEPAIRTTLLDGSVRVQAYEQSQTLKPGEQAAVNIHKQQLVLLKETDLDKIMAWKNGLFNFEDASLEEVMRQLERWYDIEVTYAKGIPAIRFGGEINKQNTLQDVLQILEKSNVHFRLEQGRKLVVIP